MDKFCGILLCGGKGIRLLPLTKYYNKHELPVKDKHMCEYPLQTLVNMGIKDIIVIIDRDDGSRIMQILGSGSQYGVNLTYRVQDEASGIAGALKMCRNFVGSRQMVVILGDNIFSENEFTEVPKLGDCSGWVALKEVDDPERFGVPVMEEDRIVDVIEKPSNPPNNYAVVGIYSYKSCVFDILDILNPSNRKELEISDLNSILAKKRSLKYSIVKDYWRDAGTLESYMNTNKFLLSKDE